jgi:hypothetical protein
MASSISDLFLHYIEVDVEHNCGETMPYFFLMWNFLEGINIWTTETAFFKVYKCKTKDM